MSTKPLKSITVFCGSSPGNDSIYFEMAQAIGKRMAELEIRLVYGGGKVGLMGAVADACLAAGGQVTGVIPGFMDQKEIAHQGVTRLEVVDSMHERKMRMHRISEAAIALPGGFGTLDELFEMLTWAQLGLHQKPIGLVNVDGYFDDLVRLADGMTRKGFVRAHHRAMLLEDPTFEGLLKKMESYTAPPLPSWINADQT